MLPTLSVPGGEIALFTALAPSYEFLCCENVLLFWLGSVNVLVGDVRPCPNTHFDDK